MKRIYSKICGVYKITNIVNGKIYIGSSKDIHVRWRAHLNYFKRGKQSKHFQNAWNKYGEKAFEWEIIEEVSRRSLRKREQEWINYYQSYDDKFGYNECPTAGSPAGKIVSEETRRKMSAVQKGRIAWNKGKRTKVQITCSICRKKFWQAASDHRRKTCSNKCRKLLMQKSIYEPKTNLSFISKKCVGCGKFFKGQAYLVTRKKYCTFICYRKCANRGHQSTKTCKVCKRKFTIGKIHKNIFKCCSKKCRKIWLDRNLIMKTCPFCHKKFRSRLYKRKTNVICCSKRCAVYYRWEQAK